MSAAGASGRSISVGPCDWFGSLCTYTHSDPQEIWAHAVAGSYILALLLEKVILLTTEMEARKFVLSKHAKQRLEERSRLTEEELLLLLERKATKTIYTKWLADMPQSEVNKFSDLLAV